MRLSAIVTLAFTFLFVALLGAQDDSSKSKKTAAKLPVGVWTRSEGDSSIRFEIKQQRMRAYFTNDKENDNIQADVDFRVADGGIMFGRVCKVGAKGVDEAVNVGMLFSFRYAIKGDKMTVSNYEGPGGEEARQLLEGEYENVQADAKEK